ncbi:hypothetical protein Spb1_10880 [Planctopirus ephydatiae]|uniref:Uncharacterized protein n=1 Tax=Planctopirus ephydatiae TaxID=2528019 RepID=A0A518GKQ8_9PLAN|nr:hypothetical protein [Planctopirus ephydatiae]QDV29210.1 hypothetical protein Spb1_10880 [Planctopirus ephydatiae]
MAGTCPAGVAIDPDIFFGGMQHLGTRYNRHIMNSLYKCQTAL